MERINNYHNQFESQQKIITIAVDVQNDFCQKSGALYVPGGESVIPPLNSLFKFTRENNGLIIATGDQHPLRAPHFDKWPIHCVRNSLGAAFDSGLRLYDDDDIFVDKGTDGSDAYSGFDGTLNNGMSLESIITPKKHEQISLLIGGLATDYCVLETILDACKVAEKVRTCRLGKISVYAIEDAMCAVNINPGDGKKALNKMKAAGAIIINSKAIINSNFEIGANNYVRKAI